MKPYSQKNKIAQEILNITTDIRDRYIEQYGNASTWNISKQDIYLLNCDAEIQCYLKKNNIDIHENVFKIGISFGILVIRKELVRRYMERYGEMITIEKKEEMYESIQRHVYDFLTNGDMNAY